MRYVVTVKEDDEWRFRLSLPSFDPLVKIKKISDTKYEIETDKLSLKDLYDLSYIDSSENPDSPHRKTTPNECLTFRQVCNRLEVYANDPLINVNYRSEVKIAEENDLFNRISTGYQIIDLLSLSKNNFSVNDKFMGVDGNMLSWTTPVMGHPIINTTFVETDSIAILVYSKDL